MLKKREEREEEDEEKEGIVFIVFVCLFVLCCVVAISTLLAHPFTLGLLVLSWVWVWVWVSGEGRDSVHCVCLCCVVLCCGHFFIVGASFYFGSAGFVLGMGMALGLGLGLMGVLTPFSTYTHPSIFLSVFVLRDCTGKCFFLYTYI